jgi:pimeloyl-ACP methyl ester carboxylesterase
LTPPFETRPSLRVATPGGATIAAYRVIAEPASGAAAAGRPILLVHGTTADHTTWRVVGPMLARNRPVVAMDRRGRGASGDGPAYAIEREFDDVAAVADALAGPSGTGAGASGTVDVVGHSYGGRCALGASLRTAAIRRVVCYEGAPVPPGVDWADDAALAGVVEAIRQGQHEAALEAFFRTVVGLDDAAIARYRADPVWPVRVAAVPTLARELDGEASPVAGLDALGEVEVPVLQLLGTASRPVFRAAAAALDRRLRDGRVLEIDGAAHAAHHTHPVDFVAAVEAFLDG